MGEGCVAEGRRQTGTESDSLCDARGKRRLALGRTGGQGGYDLPSAGKEAEGKLLGAVSVRVPGGGSQLARRGEEACSGAVLVTIRGAFARCDSGSQVTGGHGSNPNAPRTESSPPTGFLFLDGAHAFSPQKATVDAELCCLRCSQIGLRRLPRSSGWLIAHRRCDTALHMGPFVLKRGAHGQSERTELGAPRSLARRGASW